MFWMYVCLYFWTHKLAHFIDILLYELYLKGLFIYQSFHKICSITVNMLWNIGTAVKQFIAHLEFHIDICR